jgi:hypothetical protein
LVGCRNPNLTEDRRWPTATYTTLWDTILQALGYDVFNPGEVVPEFTADVGTKKGEKVDYAICSNGAVRILIECKPSSAALNVNHAAQLFRYFSVTDARLAVLTNGVIYQFYSDVEKPNKMDDKPFFSFSMDAIKPTDIKTLEKFSKASFDIDKIVQEAGNLKLQSLLRKALDKEFAEPSDEFIRLMSSRVHDGKITAAIKENIGRMLVSTIATMIRELVTERLSSALDASNPAKDVEAEAIVEQPDTDVVTTAEEISGFHIVQAIASKLVDPKRIVLRDAKSYCAILLDNNNRKTIARLHFNGLTSKYLGLFSGKDEERHLIAELTEVYRFAPQLEARLKELDDKSGV